MDEKELKKLQAQDSYKMANDFHEEFLYSVTTAEELKVVDTLLKELARTDSTEIVLPASYVKDRTKSTRKGGYLKHLHDMVIKIGRMGLTYSTKQYPMVYQNWFRKVELDEQGNLKATFDEFFKEYFDNNMQKRYTLVLDEKMDLKSKYSLKLYDYLQRWHYAGECRIEMPEFRKILGIPSEYTANNINQRVLTNKVLDELGVFFKDLKVERVYEKQRRGRPAVAAYIFRFKPEKPKARFYQTSTDTQDMADRQSGMGDNTSRMTCPECGEKAVIELTARSDNHQFWKCESCQTTFSTIAEVKGIPETPSRTAKIDDTATNGDEPCSLSDKELDAAIKRILSKSNKSADVADPDTASGQQEKPSKPENQYLMLEATKLKKLVNNSKSGEIGIKKLCNQLDGVVERQNVLADIIPIAEAAGYTATVTKYFASDESKPKTIKFDKK